MISPEELESITLKDILSYGISYIDLLQNRKWEVKTRPWIIQLYEVVNPYYIEKNPIGQARKMVTMKSTQCGLSTMGIVRMFHFADFWPISCYYMLPRDQDVLDFVSTRIDPMIKASPRLRNKLGMSRVGAKEVGDSYLYFMYSSIEPRMNPADILFVDEIDLSDQTHIATAVNRMDASSWGLEYNFSTPTVSNYGIHARFLHSDQREWLVRCRYCSYEQQLDWDANLRVLGRVDKPREVFYGCAHCNEELTLDTINKGHWVAKKPDRTPYSVGFHISQMMTFPASRLYRWFRDPQTKLYEFYRKRLGVPYELGEGSLEREDLLINCFDEPVELEKGHDGSSRYYMAVDQGNEIQVMVGKIPKGSDRPQIVYVEIIPFDVGFSRVAKLMRLFRIRRCVADANPNRHSIAAIQKTFPGRMILADYVRQKKRYKIIKEKKKGFIERVTIERTENFDNLFDLIRRGHWLLPGTPPALPQEVELIIDHTTALRRDIETRNLSSGPVEIGVYRSTRADHLAHTWGYLQVAIDIDRGKRFRMATLEPEDEIDEQDEELLSDDVIKSIIYYLAEVPEEQIIAHLTHDENSDYKIPFPLSHKINQAQKEYEMDEILWVMDYMLETYY